MKGLLIICLLALIAGPAPVRADGATPLLSGEGGSPARDYRQSSISVFKYSNRQGVTSFSDRAPEGLPYQKIRVITDCYACRPESTVDWHSTPLHLTSFEEPINAAARRYRVDPALIRAVIHAESGFRPQVRSRAGAMGLMQLMPDTARELGVTDPLSPVENIHGGVRYLASLMEKTGGNITLATAAYNAGPGAVERYQGIPPYAETETYVKRVRILLGRYRENLARQSRS